MTDRLPQPSADARPEVVEGLSKAALFAALPPAIAFEIAARSTMRTFRRGELLWHHGAPSESLGVVVSGRVKCWSPGHESRQWVSSVQRPGGVCGLAACVDGGAYTCNAEPIERSRVVLVPAAALRSAMERSPSFARSTAQALARDVRRIISACEDVTLRTPAERLARFLTAQAAGSRVVELSETQTQIAAQLGTVREVVGRSLRHLEAEGIISREGRTVRVLQPEALAEAASNGRTHAAAPHS